MTLLKKENVKMTIETIPVGELETNCYLIYDDTAAVVVDPGDEPERILSRINGRTLSAILLTHGHFDHIGAVSRLKAETMASVYMHCEDEPLISDTSKNLGFMAGTRVDVFHPDVFVNDGDTLSFGDLTFDVLHTPGHSGGGVTYAAKGAVFSGDLIFRCSIGRFDYGSFTDEIASVKRVLASFDDKTVIYPGHGPSTTVGYEKKYNPYLRG